MTKSLGQPLAVFESLIADIERTYQDLGHQLGWRFLCVSRKVLEAPIEVALVLLNPTGEKITADQPTESCEDGAAFLTESWGGAPPGEHKVQVQIQKLFDELNQRLGLAESGPALMERSLSGFFVPFRAPRLADLSMRIKSFLFCCRLWRRLLELAQPRLIICIDRETHAELQFMIQGYTGLGAASTRTFATGWGKCTADLTMFGEDAEVRLLRLPNLSAFQIFSNGPCIEPMNKILDEACKGLGNYKAARCSSGIP
jgi:hypothetical protein